MQPNQPKFTPDEIVAIVLFLLAVLFFFVGQMLSGVFRSASQSSPPTATKSTVGQVAAQWANFAAIFVVLRWLTFLNGFMGIVRITSVHPAIQKLVDTVLPQNAWPFCLLLGYSFLFILMVKDGKLVLKALELSPIPWIRIKFGSDL